MATYLEVFNIATSNAELRDRVSVACAIVGDIILNELPDVPNHDKRMVWAANVMHNPNSEAERMTWEVLAQIHTMTIAQITSITDGALLILVETAVPLFVV